MPLDLKKIRRWIARDCDSEADAARRLQMAPPNLSRLLAGDRDDIRLSTLERLADVMGVEPGELILRAKNGKVKK